jgi:hypothetical protein
MNLFGKVIRASLYLVAAFGTAFAQASENMPGGPAVNQLNLLHLQPKSCKRSTGCIG